jgi:hypothetical protein
LIEFPLYGRYLRGVRTARGKLLAQGYRNPKRTPRFAWFDIGADPGEREPLPAEGEEVDSAREALRALRRKAVAYRRGLKGEATHQINPDKEILEALRGLGYITAGTEKQEREGQKDLSEEP